MLDNVNLCSCYWSSWFSCFSYCSNGRSSWSCDHLLHACKLTLFLLVDQLSFEAPLQEVCSFFVFSCHFTSSTLLMAAGEYHSHIVRAGSTAARTSALPTFHSQRTFLSTFKNPQQRVMALKIILAITCYVADLLQGRSSSAYCNFNIP